MPDITTTTQKLAFVCSIAVNKQFQFVCFDVFPI